MAGVGFREDGGWHAELDLTIAQYLERVAVAIETDAKTICPLKTGELKNSIDHEVRGLTARIGTNSGYGLYVELGTNPHVIRATNATVLANKETGQVFGPVVHHPGTKAQPFLRPALYRKRGAAG